MSLLSFSHAELSEHGVLCGVSNFSEGLILFWLLRPVLRKKKGKRSGKKTHPMVLIRHVVHGYLVKRFHTRRANLRVPGQGNSSPVNLLFKTFELFPLRKPVCDRITPMAKINSYVASMEMDFEKAHCLFCFRRARMVPYLSVMAAFQHLLHKHTPQSCDNSKTQTNIMLHGHKTWGAIPLRPEC